MQSSRDLGFDAMMEANKENVHRELNIKIKS